MASIKEMLGELVTRRYFCVMDYVDNVIWMYDTVTTATMFICVFLPEGLASL